MKHNKKIQRYFDDSAIIGSRKENNINKNEENKLNFKTSALNYFNHKNINLSHIPIRFDKNIFPPTSIPLNKNFTITNCMKKSNQFSYLHHTLQKIKQRSTKYFDEHSFVYKKKLEYNIQPSLTKIVYNNPIKYKNVGNMSKTSKSHQNLCIDFSRNYDSFPENKKIYILTDEILTSFEKNNTGVSLFVHTDESKKSKFFIFTKKIYHYITTEELIQDACCNRIFNSNTSIKLFVDGDNYYYIISNSDIKYEDVVYKKFLDFDTNNRFYDFVINSSELNGSIDIIDTEKGNLKNINIVTDININNFITESNNCKIFDLKGDLKDGIYYIKNKKLYETMVTRDYEIFLWEGFYIIDEYYKIINKI